AAAACFGVIELLDIPHALPCRRDREYPTAASRLKQLVPARLLCYSPPACFDSSPPQFHDGPVPPFCWLSWPLAPSSSHLGPKPTKTAGDSAVALDSHPERSMARS